jgi:hypothetical protein
MTYYELGFIQSFPQVMEIFSINRFLQDPERVHRDDVLTPNKNFEMCWFCTRLLGLKFNGQRTSNEYMNLRI